MIKYKYFPLVLKIFVTVACLYWVFSKQSFDFSILRKGFQPIPVLVILTVTGLVYVVNNWRWLILYRSQGFRISHYESLQLMLIGIFFNSIIPGGVSGDIVRGVYLNRSAVDRKVDSATSLLMDRLLGLMMMILFALGSFFFNLELLREREFATVFAILCLLFLCLVCGFCIMLSTRVYGMPILKKLYSIRQLSLLKRVHEAVQKYRHKPGVIFAALGISLISQFLTITSLILMANFMGLEAPTEVFFFCVPIGMVLTAIPISPAGIGYGQAVYMYLFDLRMGMKTTIGASIITQSQILGLFWIALGGICYLFFKQSAKRGKV